jgi:SAM-dependent methyltransferase
MTAVTPASNSGYCCICERDAVFDALGSWLRDQYTCRTCGTIPRNRALVNALNRFVPGWRDLTFHEAAPGGPLSAFLERSCRGYSSSHFFEDVPRGTCRGPHRSEDLARMTFPDASFDLFCTSDVFEHVIEPELALAEIARVLKPGGAHVFTMPWYPALPVSVVRARLGPDGSVVQRLPPIYHGNPLSQSGSLVTTDWGLDFADVVSRASRLTTVTYLERDRSKGLDGEFLEVFISRKPPVPSDDQG